MEMTASSTIELKSPRIDTACVLRNAQLCRDHFRLTLALELFPNAAPGQFVQLSPSSTTQGGPFLPRAFSIGGLRRTKTGCEFDVIYRVVGVGTTWMGSLRGGDTITVLGPLGRAFRVSPTKTEALLVIGGVGLPPLLWLAETLQRMGKRTLAFVGAQTRDLIALDMAGRPTPSADATTPTACAADFAAVDVPVIISTDDGTCGHPGNVVQALAAYADANGLAAEKTVAYTCGPERMMKATAEYFLQRGIECQVCMERPMACGMGTCQSCIVTVRSDEAAGGWRYALCCADGPVFDAERIIWDSAHGIAPG
jgi:dihydroorotate dehydrogenase electron transfer subunit